MKGRRGQGALALVLAAAGCTTSPPVDGDAVVGDVRYSPTFSGTLMGTPDTSPPSLYVTGATSDQNVMDGIQVVASEPLPPTLTATLEGGGTTIPLDPQPGGSAAAIGAFATPPDTVLPFGTTLSVAVTPALEDLAGLPASDPMPTISTMSDPGLFAENGFEGTVDAALTGGAAIVSSIGSVPAIAGAQSLWLPPSARFTARLALAPGDTVVRMSAQVLAQSSYGDGHLRVGVAGAGFSDATTWPQLDMATATATGDPTWAYAGQVTSVEIPLPAGASGEAVVDLEVDEGICGGSPLPSGVLVDDVRAE